MSCLHCIRRNYELIKNDITPLEIERYVLPFSKALSSKLRPIITGGEPTSSPYFSEIVRLFANHYNNVCVCTNGTNCEKIESLDDIKNKLEVQISLDGNNEGHNHQRNSNSFENIFNTMSVLYKKGFRIKVSSVVNKDNLKDIKELSCYLEKYKNIIWSISLEQAFNKDALSRALQISEWNDFVDYMIKNSHNRLIIRKLFDFNLFTKMERKLGRKYIGDNSIPNCGFGNTKAYIYPDLTVRPCTCVPIIVGDLTKDPTREIINNLKKMKITPSLDSVCNNCEWLYFCNGGCPGYSYNRTKRLDMGDSRCPKLNKGKK